MLRELTLQDFKAVWHIENTAHSHPWPQSIMEKQLHKKNCNYGLWQQNQLVAMAMLQRIAPEAELLNIAVDPMYQGQGYGKQLLIHTLDILAQEKFERMFLEVRASNAAAICLYESLGFNQIGVRHGYYPAKKAREDALLYAKELMYLV